MTELMDALKAHFEKHDLQYEEVEDNVPHLLFGFAGDHAEYRCALRVHEDSGLVLCYSLCPLNAPPPKRDRVAKFLTLANYGMQFGNFEMDLRDGEIRYKTSIWLDDTPLTEGLIRPLIGVNFTAMDRYMPGIVAVIATDIEAEQAIAQVEGGEPPPEAD